MMKKRKSKSFTEPLNLFYAGFLISMGLSFGIALAVNSTRAIIESALGINFLVYSRIIFSFLYLFSIWYTYGILDMRNGRFLRNGFLLFTIIYILAQIYTWIFL